VDLLTRFWSVFDELGTSVLGLAEMLPSRLAAAACSALPGVDAAGMSLFTGSLRVPIGASDTAAVLAERLQFDTGDGPCFQAHRDGRAVAADQRMLAQRWPEFATRLVAATPYRAVFSAPLDLELGELGTVDMYLSHPTGLSEMSPDDAQLVVRQVSAGLIADRSGWSGTPLQTVTWLDSPTATARFVVPVASGMVISQLGHDFEHALALLRAHASARDTTVDDLAVQVVNRQISISELSG